MQDAFLVGGVALIARGAEAIYAPTGHSTTNFPTDTS